MENLPDAGQETRIRVFVLDDQPIFRTALVGYFSDEPSVLPVGAADTRADYASTLTTARPDVVLIDPGQRRDHLPELVAHVRRVCPSVGIIVLAIDHGYDMAALTRAAKADSFVNKERTVEELWDAITRIAGRQPS